VPRGEAQTADNPFQLYKAMNNTSRHIGDYEFVNKNPIYKTLVAVRKREDAWRVHSSLRRHTGSMRHNG
jgi:hypothetical protein